MRVALCAALLSFWSLLGTSLAKAADARPADVLLFYQPVFGNLPQTHADIVLEEALRRTVARYGPYRIERYTETLVRERLLDEMLKGSLINIAIVATQPAWEEQLVPVWIPINMGLLGYRIGMVRKADQALFSAVRTAEDLKKLRIGVGQGWSSRNALEVEGFKLETAANQEALTKMLLAGRLDYFPRGVNEIFGEFDSKSPGNPELAVESELLLRQDLPNYIFVSPSAPRLAKRLNEGLESMVRDGSLLKSVLEFHAEMIQRANLCSRRLIHINNPLLSARNPLGRRELWFDPYDPKNGVCHGPAIGAPRKTRSRN